MSLEEQDVNANNAINNPKALVDTIVTILASTEYDVDNLRVLFDAIAENDYTYTFDKYYDALMSVMDKDKYNVTYEDGKKKFYGTISFDVFINDVLK